MADDLTMQIYPNRRRPSAPASLRQTGCRARNSWSVAPPLP